MGESPKSNSTTSSHFHFHTSDLKRQCTLRINPENNEFNLSNTRSSWPEWSRSRGRWTVCWVAPKIPMDQRWVYQPWSLRLAWPPANRDITRIIHCLNHWKYHQMRFNVYPKIRIQSDWKQRLRHGTPWRIHARWTALVHFASSGIPPAETPFSLPGLDR